MSLQVKTRGCRHGVRMLGLSPLSNQRQHENGMKQWEQPKSRQRKSRKPHYFPIAAEASKAFHQDRMAVKEHGARGSADLRVTVRQAFTDKELRAASTLRAQSFYAYPPGREFAGKLHQLMVAEEELRALQVLREKQRDNPPNEKSACLIAVVDSAALGNCPDDLVVDQREAVVGTLDLQAVRALPGEVLIGNCKNAAYLANVCVAEAVRQQGVGRDLLLAARNLAGEWGVDGLYVHIMAVNEIALRFYTRNGFVIEKEETVNDASARGHCLDGIEGRGRTMLLRDSKIS